MVSQVVYKNNTPKVFNNFSQPQRGYYMVPENRDEKKHSYTKGIIIGSLTAGFGTLAIMKGAVPKVLTKWLDKWKLKLEQKIANGEKLNSFYHYMLSKVNTFLAKSESVNNFTSLKDVLFQKFMWGKNGQRKFTKKIHVWVTNAFDKISRKTVNSAYSNSHKSFAQLSERMIAVNERILRDNPNNKDIILKINERLKNVNSNLERGFGINARNERLKEIKSASDGLFDYFWSASLKDIKNFKSKDMYQSSIAEEYLVPAKTKLGKKTEQLRRLITNDINDSYKLSLKAVENVQKYVSPTDEAVNKVLNSLRNNLNKYKNLSGKDEAVKRAALNEEIIGDLEKLSETFKKGGYNQDAVKSVSQYVYEMKKIIETSAQKGELQEILTLYKQILPRNEYLKLRKQIQSTVKSLDKAIDIETVQYFDKARDLKLGSAPTDVLSILGTVGAVGWFLGKADNKDERISASLKYGIPAIGAIATSLYCTAKLISGGKSMALGLLSGWLISKLGVIADNTRKKYSLDISLENKTIVKPQPDKV